MIDFRASFGQFGMVYELPTPAPVKYISDFKTRNIDRFLDNLDITDDTIVILGHPLMHTHFEDPWVEYVNEWYRTHPNPLVLLTGNFAWAEYNSPAVRFPVYCSIVYDYASREVWRRPADIKTPKSKKFIYTTSKDLPERRGVLWALIKNKLLNHGYVGYSCQDGIYNQNTTSPQFSQDYHNEVIKALPHIPIPPVGGNLEFAFLPKDFLANSYVNIAMETFFCSSGGFKFISEKPFTAMANNQIFFFGGMVDGLKRLRDAGYETFSDILDERYDDIKDDEKRIQAFCHSLVDFLNRPIEHIQRDYERVESKIVNNSVGVFTSEYVPKITEAIELAIERRKNST